MALDLLFSWISHINFKTVVKALDHELHFIQYYNIIYGATCPLLCAHDQGCIQRGGALGFPPPPQEFHNNTREM
jgi:hypothetical protein